MSRRLTNGGLCLAVLALAMTVLAVPSWAAGTRAGTNITNTARVDFTDVNGNALFQLSNTVTTTVAQVGGVIVDPNNGPVSLDPGDVFYFPHIVTNAGNFDDYINLTAVSAGGWPVTIYRDVNGNGLYEPGTDTVLTDSAGDADAIPDSGLLSDAGPGSVMRILVAVTVPAGTADGTADVTTVTGTSVFDPTKTDTATDTINVTSPNVSVVKSVAPLGAQPPGTILTYTIVVTNNGSAAASSTVLTDPIPANTTYQLGTTTYNAVLQSDALDGDNANYNIQNPGQITVNIGVLAASGGTATVTFQVQIN
jgi:trimeric autotransporter adhesin